MEVGGEVDYIPIATPAVTTRMAPDENHFNVRDNHKTVHRPQLLKRKES